MATYYNMPEIKNLFKLMTRSSRIRKLPKNSIPPSTFIFQCASIFRSGANQINNFWYTTGEYSLENLILINNMNFNASGKSWQPYKQYLIFHKNSWSFKNKFIIMIYSGYSFAYIMRIRRYLREFMQNMRT